MTVVPFGPDFFSLETSTENSHKRVESLEVFKRSDLRTDITIKKLYVQDRIRERVVMAPLTYAVVDAFTSVPFKGNPAAVIVLNTPLPDPVLQKIATEFNLSETAYITPIDAAKGRFGLRWFTPNTEFELCGHATLASAHILFSDETLLPSYVTEIEFKTNVAGVLKARSMSDKSIELELPAGEMDMVSNEERQSLVKEAVRKAFSRCPIQPSVVNMAVGIGKAYHSYLIIEINKDFNLQGAIVNTDHFVPLAPEYQAIIITQAGTDGDESFKSRVFAPSLGVPEDPVCGSAHSILGPYWLAKRPNNGDTENLLGKQVSRRYGEVGISLNKGSKIAKLRGEAVIVCKGELFLSD